VSFTAHRYEQRRHPFPKRCSHTGRRRHLVWPSRGGG
jgi:hypothetical protein